MSAGTGHLALFLHPANCKNKLAAAFNWLRHSFHEADFDEERMLKAFFNTVRWVTLDQRKLISNGFDGAQTFAIDLLLPLYTGKNLNHKPKFRRRRVVFLWQAEHFAEIHKSAPETIDVSSAYAFLRPYFGDESVFVSDGANHTAAKQAVYRAIRENMSVETDDLLFFNFSVKQIFRPGVYPVLPLVQEISAAFLLRTIFGEQGTAIAHSTIASAIAAAGNASGTYLILPNVLRWTRRFGIGLAMRRQRLALRGFIMDQLNGMNIAHHWTGETAEQARTEIIDNLMTLLIAGFETTATTITWLLYELATNQELQAEVRAEAIEKCATDPLKYFEDDSSLLALIVHETLRLHPSIPFIIREALSPVSVGGLNLSAGDYIVMSIEELHKRGFDGGSEFQPLRLKNKRALPKLATFGGGAKICPGRAIAVQQTRILCALLVTYYLIEISERTDARVLRNRVSATPKGGMVLSFKRIQ